MDLQGQLTQRGRVLLAAALSGGDVLTVLRAASGCGETDPAATVLAQEMQDLTVDDIQPTERGLLLPVTVMAAQAETAYSLTEVGIYVRDGDSESLYAVFRMDTALSISPDSGMAVRLELEHCFGDGAQVVVSPAGTVTYPALQAMLGAPNGIATLGTDAIVPVSQMPYTCSTEELEPGVSPLADGRLHFTYE